MMACVMACLVGGDMVARWLPTAHPDGGMRPVTCGGWARPMSRGSQRDTIVKITVWPRTVMSGTGHADAAT